MVWELPEVCGSSCLKPEGDASGFYVYFLLESQIVGQGTRDPVGQNQSGVPSNQPGMILQAGRIKGMIWIVEPSWN